MGKHARARESETEEEGKTNRRRAQTRSRLARLRQLIHCCITAAALCGGVASATPVISEVYYDAVGSDDGQSFVEIYGVAGSVLDGLTLEGVNGANGVVGPIIAISGVIPTDGVFVVADMDADGLTTVVNVDLLANFDFQNGPDSIVLMDGGVAIDAVGYGVFAAGEIFAGEGAPAADAPAGSSLARRFADLDRDDNALDFVVLSTPTPGTVRLTAVPEPGSGLLAAMGLVGLSLLGRRSSLPGERSRVSAVSGLRG